MKVEDVKTILAKHRVGPIQTETALAVVKRTIAKVEAEHGEPVTVNGIDVSVEPGTGEDYIILDVVINNEIYGWSCKVDREND